MSTGAATRIVNPLLPSRIASGFDVIFPTMQAEPLDRRPGFIVRYLGRCPNHREHRHGDRSPSFVLSVSSDGSLAVWCHRCSNSSLPDKGVRTILAPLGLRPRDLFPHRSKVTITERDLARAFHNIGGVSIGEQRERWNRALSMCGGDERAARGRGYRPPEETT